MNRKLISFKLLLIKNGWKRASFLKRKHIFGSIGNHVYYHPYRLPANPNLVYLGDNVIVGSDVRFLTETFVNAMFNYEDKCEIYPFYGGEIHIGNNVFLGAGSMILYNVSIGNNVIVAAGAIVTKNVPSGVIVGGVPARIIGSYSKFKEKVYSFHNN